jgi:hypothetical protein
MRSLLQGIPVSLLLLLMGCAVFEAKETTYLRATQDQATQNEVTQRLGPPALTKVEEGGKSLWVYQIRYEEPGSRMTPTGTWCDEYVLTFDSQSILRQWTHRSYFHGGELMPTYCVPGGYEAKS